MDKNENESTPNDFLLKPIFNDNTQQIEKENNFKKFKKFIKSIRGYVFVILFALCACLSSILMKKSFTLSGSDSSTIRYTVQFVAMFIVLKYKKLNPLGPIKERKLLAYRAIFGIFGLMCAFFAIKFIKPSDFKAINHSSIIITIFLARFILKEKIICAHIFALILAIIGVLFISQPTFLFDNKTNTSNYSLIKYNSSSLITNINSSDNINPIYITIGILFSLGSAFGGGSARVILKKLCNEKVHFSIATIYASYLGLPVSILISFILIYTGLAHKDFHNEIKYLPMHLVYTIIASCFGVIGQVFLNLGLKYEDASKLAIVKTVDVFFAFILQYLFLNIKVDVFNVIGALTILSGAFIVIIFKFIEKKYAQLPDAKESNDLNMKPNCIIKCTLLKF